MRTEHARLVELVSQTQRDESTGWTKRGGKRLVLPGVIFIPSLYERHRDETRPTFASRGAMFMFSTGLSTLFGACSTWDMNDKRVPFGLVAGSAAALALGVVFARKVSRADRAREPHRVLRKGLYLLDDGALVLGGEGLDDEVEKFFPRDRILGTSYQLAGRTSHTHLVTRDEAGVERLVDVHTFDVRPVLDAWLRRG